MCIFTVFTSYIYIFTVVYFSFKFMCIALSTCCGYEYNSQIGIITVYLIE